jgi:hypothetical protein
MVIKAIPALIAAFDSLTEQIESLETERANVAETLAGFLSPIKVGERFTARRAI